MEQKFRYSTDGGETWIYATKQDGGDYLLDDVTNADSVTVEAIGAAASLPAVAGATLGDVTIAPTTATVGVAYTGTVSGFADGAHLSLIGSGSAGLSVDDFGNITGTPTATGSIGIRQTLVAATNSPHDTSELVSVHAPLVIPANARFVALGDSIVSQGTSSGLRNWIFMLTSFYLNGKLRPAVAANQGVGGNTLVQMLARVQYTSKQMPDVVFLQGGHNDGFNNDVTVLGPRWQAIADAIWADNPDCIIVAMAALPSTTETTTTTNGNRDAFNAYIASQENFTGANRLIYVPVDPTWDPTIGADTVDGIHPSIAGAKKQAIQAYIKLSHYMADYDALADVAASGFHGANLDTEYALGGTGGTLAGTLPATGVVATGKRLTNNLANGTGVSVVGSKGTKGSDATQIITITGTPAAEADVRLDEAASSNVTVDGHDGEFFEALIGVKYSASDGVSDPIGLRNVGESASSYGTTGDLSTNSPNIYTIDAAIDGVLRTWPSAGFGDNVTISPISAHRVAPVPTDLRIELFHPIVRKTELTAYAVPFYCGSDGLKGTAEQCRITGTAGIGQILTGRAGAWSGGGLSFAYQWKRFNATDNSFVEDIDGATARTYTQTVADQNYKIGYRLTATNSLGTATFDAPLTAVVPATLQVLSVDITALTIGVAYSLQVNNRTAGSTLALSGAGSAGLTVDNDTGIISGTPTTAGAVNIIETLAGATGSPKTTTGIAAVSAPSTFPTLASAFYRIDPASNLNTTYTVNKTFAPSAVDISADTIYLPDLPIPFAAWTGMSSAKAARCWFETSGSLPGGLSTGEEYYLAPTGTAGYYWVYPVATDANWPSLYANVPNAILAERVLPAQYLGQAANKINLTSQGSGTHTVKTWKRATAIADADGRAFYSGDPAGVDLHKTFEIRTDGKKSWIEHELLLRNPDMNYIYNTHGFGAEQGPSGSRIDAQNATGGKRTIAASWAIRWGETDTWGTVKVPFVPANLATATGYLTFANHGLVTGYRARVLPRADGGVLPTGYVAGTDYYVYRVSSSVITLHVNPTDASTGANPIKPTDTGSVGFTVYCPDQMGDYERTRFLMELRRPSDGSNRLTIRSNFASFTKVWQSTVFTVSGSSNGNVGASGNSMTPAVPTNTAYCQVRLRFANDAGGPIRQDTGLPLTSGIYWMTRLPNSTSSVRLHLTESDAVASLGLATASATCIKYTAQGTSSFQVETVKRYVTTNVERGSEPNQSTLGWDSGLTTYIAPWGIPLGEDGTLTVIADYDDPASGYVRTRTYWNKTLVQDWQPTDGAKGLTSTATSSAMAAWTLLNSPDGHVTFEGRVYGAVVAASDGAITIDDLGGVVDFYTALMAA